MSARLTWLVALATAATLTVQLSLAWVVVDRTRPRLPDLVAVEPLLDKGIADILAATGDRAAVAVSGVIGYTACQKTWLAKGHRYNRAADLYTDPGTEDTLIAQVLARMPAADHARRGVPVGGGTALLTADLGTGVTLRLSQLGDGWLEAVAETDCRAGHQPPDSATVAPADRTLVQRLLAGLGTTVDSAHTSTIVCAAHPLTTLSAISGTTDTDDLARRLAALVPAGAHRYTSVANRLAWRDGTGSTIVAASDDGTHITVQHTTPC